MAMYRVRIEDTGEQIECRHDCSVLHSMERLGRRGIPVGCRSGGCGVCKVRILKGHARRKVMSRAHVSADEEIAGLALACRLYPDSDLQIQVVGKMRRAFAAPPGNSSGITGMGE